MDWQPVPHWQGMYEINRRGQVRSLPRYVERGCGRYWVRGGVLAEQVVNGHRAVYLKNAGRRETVYIAAVLREVYGHPALADAEHVTLIGLMAYRRGETVVPDLPCESGHPSSGQPAIRQRISAAHRRVRTLARSSHTNQNREST